MNGGAGVSPVVLRYHVYVEFARQSSHFRATFARFARQIRRFGALRARFLPLSRASRANFCHFRALRARFFATFWRGGFYQFRQPKVEKVKKVKKVGKGEKSEKR